MTSLARLRESRGVLGSTWAVARTLVAGAGLLTLATNAPQTVYSAPVSLVEAGRCTGLAVLSAPCLLTDGEYTWTTHVVLLLALGLVASGIFPRIAGPLHVYAAFSLLHSLSTVDGGEQAGLVFSVLALPICLVDPRRSHWRPWPSADSRTAPGTLTSSTVLVFSTVIKLQISLIYLQACLAKLAVPEWADGTAFYYWTVDGYLRPPSFAEPLVDVMATSPLLVLAATYGTLALEFALAVSLLVTSAPVRAVLAVIALAFHLLIALTFAIWSFALVMAGLVLFLLSPPDLSAWWRERAATSSRLPAPPSIPEPEIAS